MKKLIIAIDLDGVITDFKHCNKLKSGCDYSKCKQWNCPIMPGIIDVLSLLHTFGHTIVIHTSRTESRRKSTEKFLNKNNIYYDNIIFDKFRADVYVDDKGLLFKKPGQLLRDIKKLENGVKE